MVPAARRPRTDAPLVNPLLERRVADAQTIGGGSGRDEWHMIETSETKRTKSY
jgi:hypothetical protein